MGTTGSSSKYGKIQKEKPESKAKDLHLKIKEKKKKEVFRGSWKRYTISVKGMESIKS
jgi:hypothetical protein